MSRSILIISYYFPPLGMAGVQRPLGLAKYLHRQGWRVYVLTVKPISYWETDPSLLEDFPKEISIFRAGSLDPARLSYLMGRRKRLERSFQPASNTLLWDSKLGSVPFLWAKGCRLIEKFSISAVWTTSPPPSIHLAGCWLKRTNDVKWFADFRDPWEVEAPEENSNRWQKRKKKLQRLLAAADGVTAVNEGLKDFLVSFTGADKVTTVYNGFDPEIVYSNAGPPAKVFTLAYGGTLSPSTDPHAFPAALSRWKKERKRNFRLILIGRIFGLPIGKRLAELGLIENVEIAGYLPHRAALEKLAGANLLLLFLSEEEKYRLTVPAKLFEYIGLGRPVLAVVSEKGAVAKFFSRHPVGALCSREEKIIEKLEFYYQQWEKGFLPVFPETLRNSFGWDKQAERLSHFIESRLK
ncbi:MAG: glycosyltransferase [Candidatus Zixiibacteriota bacterium]